jgi:hypothetical protein
MINNNFEFIIASPIDREKLICEIYYQNEIIAEISQETDELMIEIYPCQKNKFWELPLIQFQNALEYAKNHLLSK